MTEAAQSKLICSLDIGSSNIRAVVAEVLPDGVVNVLGTGTSLSKGIVHGSVSDFNAVIQSVKDTIEKAEIMSNKDINGVQISISGEHIRSTNKIIAEDLLYEEVRQEEIDKIMEKANSLSVGNDEQILHVIPQEYRVDNLLPTRTPLNQLGRRLYGSMHIISCNQNWLKNIQKAVEAAGVTVHGQVFSGLASTYSVLTDEEKEQGVFLVDFGGGTIDVVLYTGGALRFSRSYPFAGKDVTNFLCGKFRTPFSEAEKVKLCASALNPPKHHADKKIEMAGTVGYNAQIITKEELSEYTSYAYTNMLRIVANDLRQVCADLQQRGLPYSLNAGIVFTGGSASAEDLVEAMQPIFANKIRVGKPLYIEGLTQKVNSSAHATVIGLLQYSFYNQFPERVPVADSPITNFLSKGAKYIKHFFKNQI